MLHGPWKEAGAPILTLQVDDKNVNGEAIAMALAYLYGHHPKLNNNNAFRVLAAASFLDLQDLCAICTDFIISELWTSNFLAYQVFAERQDYGLHGERVRSACWGYLCQSGARELKEVLPKLSSQTLHALLTSDELWVPSEEKRFELAIYALLAKSSFGRTEHTEEGCSSNSQMGTVISDPSNAKGKDLIDGCANKTLESEVRRLRLKDDREGYNSAQKLLVELADCVVDHQLSTSEPRQPAQSPAHSHLNAEPLCPSDIDQSAPVSDSFSDTHGMRTSCSYPEMPIVGTNGMAMEGPSEEGSCYDLNNSNWAAGKQPRHCSSMDSSCNELGSNEWGRCDMPPLPWGGRVVGRRRVKGNADKNCGVHEEEYDAFVNIFEGGSLLYCNMSFESLLNVRKQLEEWAFPCKAVNDGLWLQMLLSQRVQEIGAETCNNCCYTSLACACRQQYRNISASHPGVPAGTGFYMQDHDQSPSNGGNVYVADAAQSEGSGLFRPVRVHVRGPIDGLAGIGRGNSFVQTAAWPPTRFVFSRVPFGMGNRSSQQSPANDDSDARVDHNEDMPGDGLTALVGLSQGGCNTANVHALQTEDAGPMSSGIAMQVLESPEHTMGMEWENDNGSSISLDLKTPLSHFPPFRFGVEFEDVHRLSDGQVKHSPEFFYAGSLWKVSVQAFNDEDPQGRRTLGLFLHRRKADMTDSLRKVHMYVDSREKVFARYQLICPSKREVLVFGSLKQKGTLLPKAPKGWGWRTALLFDELADLLQNGSLRVAAVVQLV